MCSHLRRDLGFLCCSFLGFLDRSVSRAMGCFFDCFKVRDDRHRPRSHLVSSDPSSSKYRVCFRSPFSVLFLDFVIRFCSVFEEFGEMKSGGKFIPLFLEKILCGICFYRLFVSWVSLGLISLCSLALLVC